MKTGLASGVIVIDIDRKGSVDGTKWLNSVDLPNTRTHSTKNGGYHLFFSPNGAEIKNSAGKIAPGVDVRGDGGYVIVPPSPGYCIVYEDEIALLPQWLADACTKTEKAKPEQSANSEGRSTAYAQKALRSEVAAVLCAPEGTRNNRLNQAACVMGNLIAGGAIGRGEVERALAGAAALAGLDTDEAEATIASGIEAGLTSPRTAPEDGPTMKGQSAQPPSRFSDRVFDPWNTLEPPTFPDHALPPVLRSFVMERARIIGADPCAIAWSAISACSAALHGGIRLQIKRNDQWAVPPAIWVCLVGSSSTKKTPIVNAAWGPIDAAQKPAFREYEGALKACVNSRKRNVTIPLRPRTLCASQRTMARLRRCNPYSVVKIVA